MTLRQEFARARPDFPLLEAGDVPRLTDFLSSRGWLETGETVVRCDRAGAGNMNLTLRVETTERTFILKQARPWVEKYDHIPAPLERAQFEGRFYERVRGIPGVADRMPELLHLDPDAGVLVLEDLGDGADLTSLYRGGEASDADLDALVDYLRALHDGTRLAASPDGGPAMETFANRAMRALNHAHLFVVPLEEDNELPLDELAPGLTKAADDLRADTAYRKLVGEASARYLGHDGAQRPAPGACLLHGDYFPGSWLRSERGLCVIDPEFAFPGDPDVDVGCAIAHLALAQQPLRSVGRFRDRYEANAAHPLDGVWLARNAAVEVMRRLIGVAQLPLPPDAEGRRAALLLRSRSAMLSGEVEALFA